MSFLTALLMTFVTEIVKKLAEKAINGWRRVRRRRV